MNLPLLITLLPLFPLVGAIVLGLLGKKIFQKTGEKTIGILACIPPILSACCAIILFFNLLQLPEAERTVSVHLADWIGLGALKVQWLLHYDPLSAIMTMIITCIGSLIHIYATGYMHGDKSVWRFFSYTNLFLASMLMLVLGGNLLVMFLGWEGVGLCSYLLIGFWFSEEANAVAGKKAFLTNRIGDLGFLVGIFLLMFFSLEHYDSLDLSFAQLASRADVLATMTVWGWPLLNVVTFCFFIGAMGKSAQIPLYVWLPDAMAGPTPVSALIHAATMVTAGVYMIGRMNFFFTLAPDVLSFIAVIAALTCFFAATIGTSQYDIKKVLAYSTVSQLGYMFLAMGVGAYSAGIFHLLTHATFKAALFMGSGSVIVAMHHEQDMRKMGGLYKKMPITGISFIFATLAIMGFPLTSGFFSKDEILWKAFSQGSVMLWALGFVAAGLTSFYMWRLIFMTFFGHTRADHHTYDHCHEQPKNTVLPILTLAVASLVVGFLNVPHVLGGHSAFTKFLSPVVHDIEGGGHGTGASVAHEKSNPHGASVDNGNPHGVNVDSNNPHGASVDSAHGASVVQGQHKEITGHNNDHVQNQAQGGGHDQTALEWTLMIASVLWTLLTAFLAYFFYIRSPQSREKFMQSSFCQGVFRILNNKYFVDEIYEGAILGPTRKLSRFMSQVDKWVVDGAVNLSAMITRMVSWLAGQFDRWIVDGIANLLAILSQSSGQVLSLFQAPRIQTMLRLSLILLTTLIFFIFLKY